LETTFGGLQQERLQPKRIPRQRRSCGEHLLMRRHAPSEGRMVFEYNMDILPIQIKYSSSMIHNSFNPLHSAIVTNTMGNSVFDSSTVRAT